VAGPGTYIHELIELSGGRNAFEDLGSLYAAVSVEEFIARPVDLIVTPDVGGLDPHTVAGARVAEVGGGFELPGPSVVDAARLLARIVHPPGDR
jgi:ABC-type Fe3+-hydroxamate transport system substrate-binding protein